MLRRSAMPPVALELISITTIGTTEAALFLDNYVGDNVDEELAVMLSAPWERAKPFHQRAFRRAFEPYRRRAKSAESRTTAG